MSTHIRNKLKVIIVVLIFFVISRCQCYEQFNNTDLSILEGFYQYFNISSDDIDSSSGRSIMSKNSIGNSNDGIDNGDSNDDMLVKHKPIVIRDSSRWNSSNIILYIMCHDIASCKMAKKNCKHYLFYPTNFVMYVYILCLTYICVYISLFNFQFSMFNIHEYFYINSIFVDD